MEALYKKLYDKYSKLKAKKETDMDKLNRDQEVKLVEYMTAAENLIEGLMAEKNKLQADLDAVRDDLHSLRSAKDQQYLDYEKLLFEERQKNRLLSMEVERLQKLQKVGISTDADPQHVPPSSVDISTRSLRSSTRKRTRYSRETEAALVSPSSELRSSRKKMRYITESGSASMGPFVDNQIEHLQTDLPAAPSKEPNTDMETELPFCCRRNLDGVGPCDCLFQSLVECLIGMKVSIIKQSEGICITAVHQSSGYSFSLTWINKAATEDVLLLYRVLSLGTFERLAPGWMRDVLKFRLNMFPLFFERLSRVIRC